jgi:hypothetical protein
MIIFNYPFAMWSALQNIEDIVFSDQISTFAKYFVDLKRICLRFVGVAITAGVAAGFNNFGILTTLTGAWLGFLCYF